jgi:hypothetical protein
LKKILKNITKTQLDTPYRSGGWTVRQVIHHLSDSHVNAYIRMKMAVTEKNPIIKPYDEQAWAELESGKAASVKPSVRLLKVLHSKWIDFLESLSVLDLEKGYFHPAMNRVVLLPEAIALYAWHTEHHLGHIRLVSSGKLEIPPSKAEQKFEKAAAKATAKASEAVSATKADSPKSVIPQAAPNKEKATPAKQVKVVAGVSVETPANTTETPKAIAKSPVKKTASTKAATPKAAATKDKVVSASREEARARIAAARQEALAEEEARLAQFANIKKEKTTVAAPQKASTTALPKTPAPPKAKAAPVAKPEKPAKVKKESTTSDEVKRRRLEGLEKARAVKQAKAAAEKDAAQPENPTTDQ